MLTIGIALALSACSERNAPKSRGSRAGEYRAALEAYSGGQHSKALEHFRNAADQGNVNAQFYTGLMYANGEGVKQDFKQAAKWYQRAAEHNQPDALVQLARLYATGSGVNLDARKAVELFGRAAQAYPPGEKKDQALEQKNALIAVLDSPQTPAVAPAQ